MSDGTGALGDMTDFFRQAVAEEAAREFHSRAGYRVPHFSNLAEPVRIKCEYCGVYSLELKSNCDSCGAGLNGGTNK